MTSWTKFLRTDGQTPDARSLVTLRSAALAFNAHFIRANKLQECTRITVYCDTARYRVGLRFHSDISDQNSFALTADGGRSGGDGRVTQISAVIKQHLWMRSATKLSNPSRRYQPTWNAIEHLWVLNIRPSFENSASSSADIEAGLCGIYRYWANGQIVYIGRGDIRARANSSERADWVIDKIEYSVIPEESEQEKWEALWLDEHRNEHGILPLYNRIGGKRGGVVA